MADETTPQPRDPAPKGPTGAIDRVDAILAGVLIALCAGMYSLTFDFPVPGLFLGQNVLPEQFPRMLLITIGALALLLPFEHRFEIDRWPLIRKSRSAPIGGNTIATMGFLIVLVALGEWLGSVLMIFIAALGLPILWGERRWLMLGLYAVGFTALVTWVFGVVLSVYFEPGVLGLSLR